MVFYRTLATIYTPQQKKPQAQRPGLRSVAMVVVYGDSAPQKFSLYSFYNMIQYVRIRGEWPDFIWYFTAKDGLLFIQIQSFKPQKVGESLISPTFSNFLWKVVRHSKSRRCLG